MEDAVHGCTNVASAGMRKSDAEYTGGDAVSWPMVKLGELVSIKGGGTPSKNIDEYWNGDIPWASVKDLKSRVLAVTQDYITLLGVENSATNVIPSGTIIIPTRMALGKVVITTCEMAINQDLKAIFINDPEILDQSFFARYLESKSKYIEGEGKGATVKGITLEFLKNIEIPLPPLEEQKRIAAILDKADAIRQKRKQAITLADDFLRSVFLDMFGDPVTNPKGWEVKTLKEVASCQLGKMLSQKAKEGDLQRKYLRNANVRWRKLDLVNLLEMNFDDREQLKFELKKGDLLVCEGGEIGRCAIWNEDLSDCYYQKALHRVRPNTELVTATYIQEYLYSMALKHAFSETVSEVTFSHLTAEKLKQLRVPVPDIALQQKFDEIYWETLNLHESKLSCGWESFPLFQSLSKKAFSGQL